MGFGLIFAGFVTLLFFKTVPISLIGCAIMYKGLSNLCEYDEKFKKAKNACAAFFIYFCIYACLWFLNAFSIFNFTSNKTLLYADEFIYYFILCFFCFFLYTGLGSISKAVGFEKGVRRETLAKSFLYVFTIMTATRFVLSIFKLEIYLRVPLLFFELIWLIYSCVYIYSCYMMIATQEIIDEENKKMRQYDEKYSFRTKKKNLDKK